MRNGNCDFSPLKERLIQELKEVSLEVDIGLQTLAEDNFCLLGKLATIKEHFEKAEAMAASFYLNCYLSPFTDRYLDISTAVQHLSNQRHGALIVIERENAVETIIRPGTPIGAKLTHSLLESIFYPGNPLHDGAVLIRSNEILSAANVLPLSGIYVGEKKLGTRHRAAIGLSERSDALVLVVSEETGKVSFALNGELHPIITTSSAIL
ncbi:sporulation-specific diadenylate cyclase CdaS [Psychrobacillus sp. NEAU-3TGS]|uniref:sporulation-specific diadenylate cyclase CdaS n=1 Tax=Psychrobacillus sp. NEAU-3TGS TaxID=2995412 RepID=UPI00249703B5|nr:sporulation-specific diadenylate cyclase CdaS [Psychrobacillus sp. NEAU-3TGS]MDI2589068.1 sporulation-specific diadenylate cyclase CdaS [Psychrobacillus sp. NEAU-3TGS]